LSYGEQNFHSVDTVASR